MTGAPETAILVFARAPIPGTVKTRLIPALGATGAARLHELLVRNALAAVVDAAVAPVEIWCNPTTAHPVFQDVHRSLGVRLRTQQGRDLGERMAFAISESLKSAETALLIGTDCPALSPDDLRAAHSALRSGYDAVIGPAEDGGYVLIGLRRPAPELFSGIEWGGAEVLGQTRERMTLLHLRWLELPVRWDVDRPADLVRLAQARPDLCAGVIRSP